MIPLHFYGETVKISGLSNSLRSYRSSRTE